MKKLRRQWLAFLISVLLAVTMLDPSTALATSRSSPPKMRAEVSDTTLGSSEEMTTAETEAETTTTTEEKNSSETESTTQAATEEITSEATEVTGEGEDEDSDDTPTKEEEADEDTKTEENTTETIIQRENDVTFIVRDGAEVTVDDLDVTVIPPKAVDGVIVFTVSAENDYEITEILVDGKIHPKKNTKTDEENDYIIRGIKTDKTVVEVKTRRAMPKQKFAETTDDGIKVAVEADEGIFPIGTTMEVTSISEEEAVAAVIEAKDAAGENPSVNTAIGVDISFLDEDGTEIEPQDKQKVKVQITLDKNSTLGGKQFSIIHKPDEGTAEIIAEKNVKEVTSKKAVFYANEFSIYVVSGGNIDGSSSTTAAKRYTVSPGDTIRLIDYGNNISTSGTWSKTGTNANYISISSTSSYNVNWRYYPYAQVSIADNATPGTAEVTYTYGNTTHTFYINISTDSQFTLNPTLTNADAYYVVVDGNGNVLGEGSCNSTTVVQVNKSKITSTDGNYYINVFVKGTDNYLITGLGADGAGYIYPIDRPGGPAGKVTADTLSKLKAAGYVGTFGWTRSSTANSQTLGYVVHGVQPIPTARITSNKTTDVTVGDELTLTVNVAPGSISTDSSARATLNGNPVVKINGVDYEVTNCVRNSDGSYTGTVQYIATLADCSSGKIVAEVEATFDYEYRLGTTTATGSDTVTTKASITASSGETYITIAETNDVTYVYTYSAPSDIASSSYPTEITTVPKDNNKYYRNQNVSVSTTPADGVKVNDSVNNGTWEFDGWYLNGTKVKTAKMTDNGLIFVGRWTFTANDDQLTYDANGGSGTMEATVGKTYDNVTVSENGFTREGYNFIGWNTAADGSGTSYNSGDDYKLTPGTDILYAQWEKKAEITVVKKVVGNMGDKNKEFSFTVTNQKNQKKEFTLKDGQSNTFNDLDLTIGNTITLKESDNSEYTVTVQYGSYDDSGNFSGSDITASNGSYNITLTKDKNVILVTNDRTTQNPTGVNLGSSIPLILFIVLAGAFITFITFTRRRMRV